MAASLRHFVNFEWKAYEIVWLFLFSSVALFQVLLYDVSLFSFTVFLSGILCVLLAAKGHISNYIVGLYNSIGYAWLAYENGLYGEMGLNIFFFAPMAVVGVLLWRKNLAGARVLVRTLSTSVRIQLLAGLLVFSVLLGWLLAQISGQNTPYIDAFTNSLSISATILMALRYREQWIVYIILNILSIIMWLFRYLADSSEGMIMLAMWSAYLVNSVYGWWNWGRGATRREVAG